MFVSSTFVDMHEERETLIKKVFPRLRDYCRDRGVFMADVDLRWGVTARQSERGRTLSICLAEIDRCWPFFIGILGDRSVARISASDLKIHPWLSTLAGSSLTEIEIEYAVLSRRPTPERAAFYFRAESSLLRGHRDPEHSRKLEALKQRIRQSAVPLHEG